MIRGCFSRLEYASPESLPSPDTGLLKQVDSKADMWSLGMILHKLLFLKLPYRYAADGDAVVEGNAAREIIGDVEKMEELEREVLNYSGSAFYGYLVSSLVTPLFL